MPDHGPVETQGVSPTRDNLLLRLAVEHFLWEEAALLDDWRLEEWLTLFTDDARYVVPATDVPDAERLSSLMLIDDDVPRLKARVDRLRSRHAHREYPYSRTRRLITNVRLTRVDHDEVEVEAAFAVYRSRAEQMAAYVGKYRYTLARVGDGQFRVRARRAQLDAERLSEHGAISIIL